MIHVSPTSGQALFIGKAGHRIASKKLTVILAALASGQDDVALAHMQKAKLTRDEAVQLVEETAYLIEARRRSSRAKSAETGP